MEEKNIPDILVNKENLLRAMRESRHYRNTRTVMLLLALIGWGAFVFLLFKR